MASGSTRQGRIGYAPCRAARLGLGFASKGLGVAQVARGALRAAQEGRAAFGPTRGPADDSVSCKRADGVLTHHERSGKGLGPVFTGSQ